jgi:hypothetical protein
MDDLKTLRQLVEAIGQAQAANIRDSFILTEIVRDLAKQHPDPQRYIAAMFERISARADQGSIENESHPVNAEFRDGLARFFSLAGRDL